MKRNKSQKGITLVALIITIIVLLILAVVAIRAVTGDGILEYAQNSVDKHQAGVDEENTVLDSYLAKLEERVPGGQKETIPTGETIGTNGDTIRIGDLVYIIESKENKTAKVYANRGNIDYTNPMSILMSIPTITKEKISIEEKVEINGEIYMVNTISSSAFNGCALLKEITIPNSITSIEDYAFQRCTNLRGIVATGVKNIGSNVFYGCTSLSSIEVKNVISIGESAFYECTMLNSIDVPNIKNITNYSFYKCTSLSSIVTSNITTIGECAFYGCTSLSSIDISSVTSIGSSAFSKCTSLSSIDITSVTNIGQQAFCESGIIKIEIPSTATTIGLLLFNGCENLIGIYIPDLTEAPSGWDTSWSSGVSSDKIFWNTAMPIE